MFTKKHSIDWFLVISIALVLVFGLIMINSVSVYDYLLTLNDPRDYDINYFAVKQMVLVGVSVLIFIGVCNINYRFWRKASLPMYVLSLILLLLLFHPMFGRTINGATGWLYLGSFSMQPIELAKLAMILYLARWLEPKVDELKQFDTGFFPFMIIVGAMAIPILAQPDFGGLLVMIPICIIMFYVAGGKMKHLMYLLLAGVLIFVIAFTSFAHVRNRVHDFFDSSIDPSKKNVGWQIQQSLIAVGSGGFMGRGINKSIQKWGYLPEVQNDMIFAAIGEETGFRGSVALVLVYLFMAWRGFTIAQNAPDKFAKYVAAGISFWIVWQAFVNIGVVIKILPLTGITLPFISAGGSSLITLLTSMGILVNISAYTTVSHDYFISRRRVGRPHSS